MPASMDEGCAWKVVVRAYTICLLCVGQRLDGAAVHFIVLPTSKARQWAGGCQPDGKVAQIVNAHIVAANRSQRRFEDVFREHSIVDMAATASGSKQQRIPRCINEIG